MATPYQRGMAFEHRVKALLEEQGWLVVRSPASRSLFDLLALKPNGRISPVIGHNGANVMVQCKLRGKISGRELVDLHALADEFNCEAALAYTLKERGEVHFKIAVQELYGQEWRLEWQSWSP